MYRLTPALKTRKTLNQGESKLTPAPSVFPLLIYIVRSFTNELAKVHDVGVLIYVLLSAEFLDFLVRSYYFV